MWCDKDWQTIDSLKDGGRGPEDNLQQINGSSSEPSKLINLCCLSHKFVVTCHGSISSAGKDMGDLGFSDTSDEIQDGIATLENILAVYCKLNKNLPCNPGLSFLDISPLEMKTQRLFIIFTAALLIVATN